MRRRGDTIVRAHLVVAQPVVEEPPTTDACGATHVAIERTWRCARQRRHVGGCSPRADD